MVRATKQMGVAPRGLNVIIAFFVGQAFGLRIGVLTFFLKNTTQWQEV